MKNLHYSALSSIADLRTGNYIQVSKIDVWGNRARLLKTPSEILMPISMTFGDVVIRLACNMGQISECTIISSSSHGALVEAKGTLGDYSIELTFHHEEIFSMECRTRFTPTMGIRQLQLLPELLLLEGGSHSAMKPGRLYLQQDQLRSGACLFDLADAWGTAFLFHDLGELSTFAEDTRTSLAGSVRARWPEVGIYIRSNPEGNLKRGRKYIVNHFYLILEKGPVQCEKEASRRFVSCLARIYPKIRKPAVRQENFVSIAQGCIETLSKNHGCWQRVGKFSYLNAYLNDYATPPESMVQMAILPSLHRYARRLNSRRARDIASSLSAGISEFFNEKTGTIERWMPSKSQQLTPTEEQKKPRIMDSWYLHHPLLQISYLLEDGNLDDGIRELFFKSVEFCTLVASKFDYEWPVFYDMDTLHATKEETAPGKGGQKDVGGLYAMLMMRAYKLTGDKRYLSEATKAGDALMKYGLDLLYQSNNTATAAEALVELWSVHQDVRYLEQAQLCLGNLIRNTSIWDRQYGNSKNIPTFFSLFPLSDAPYSAVFEEQECVSTVHRTLRAVHFGEKGFSDELEMLLAEYIRYSALRIPYYFPPMLPEDMLSPEPKTGFLDKDSWIPVEDIGDGWQPIGTVGQEVYGMGAAFSLLDSLTVDLMGKGQFLFINYPFVELERNEYSIRLKALGLPSCEFDYQFHGLGEDEYSIGFENGKTRTFSGRVSSAKACGGQLITVKKM